MIPGALDEFFELARQAHACGAEVMFDVESTIGIDPMVLERVLAVVDIASFNRDGFVTATGAEPTIATARRLLDYGPHTVAVTSGARGSLAVTADSAAERPGYRVEVVDTTGAGDTFNAAFLSTTLAGLPIERRLRFANAAAALSVTAMGPRGYLPTRQEVEVFLQSTIEE
jgi:ribokinase/sulfofructose kinase